MFKDKPQTVQSTIPYIKDKLIENNFVLMIVTETWETGLKDHNDSELRIDCYEIIWSDRKRPKSRFGRSSGGVAI